MASVRGRIFSMITSMQNINPSANPDAVKKKKKMAAKYLDVNKDTIRNWIKKNNDIPAHKIGKLWKFKKSELDASIKSGKSAS